MDRGELTTFLIGIALGLVATAIVWWFTGRRRRAQPPVVINQIQLPVENPTAPTSDSETSSEDGTDWFNEHDRQKAERERTERQKAESERDSALHEMIRLRQRVETLSLQLERVQQHDAETTNRWQAGQQRLVSSEAGLDQARHEIAEIRGLVLQLRTGGSLHVANSSDPAEYGNPAGTSDRAEYSDPEQSEPPAPSQDVIDLR